MDEFAATQDEHTKEPVAPVAVGPYCAVVRVKTPCEWCGSKETATRYVATTDGRLCIARSSCERRERQGWGKRRAA